MPRCAEFSRWLQCRTIYRKKMEKNRKLYILPFLGSLFQMAPSQFSKNEDKLEIYVFLLASWQPPSWILMLWANIASTNHNRWDKTRNNLFVWSRYELTWKIQNKINILNFKKFQTSKRHFELENKEKQNISMHILKVQVSRTRFS